MAGLRAALAEAVAAQTLLGEVIEAKDAELAAKAMQVTALRDSNEVLSGQLAELALRVEELERQKGRDSTTSDKPPGSAIYQKKTKPAKKKASRDRLSCERGVREPGRQWGEPGSTMRLVDDPQERFECPPAACDGCGTDLTGAPVSAEQRRQVTEVAEPVPPRTTEFVVQAKVCSCCGQTSVGQVPEYVSGRAQFGPGTHAHAANLVVGHHVPIRRATLLLAQMAGIEVSVALAVTVPAGNGATWTRVDRDYEKIRIDMQTLFHDLGIQTTGTAA